MTNATHHDKAATHSAWEAQCEQPSTFERAAYWVCIAIAVAATAALVVAPVCFFLGYQSI